MNLIIEWTITFVIFLDFIQIPRYIYISNDYAYFYTLDLNPDKSFQRDLLCQGVGQM